MAEHHSPADGASAERAEAPPLPALEPCSARVVDEEGSPIAGAILSVFEGSDGPPRAVVETGPDGWARFDAGENDEALVEARGYASLVTGEFEEPIVLSQGSAVAGIVVDAQGNALAQALIGYDAGRKLLRTTDERGAFRLDGLDLNPLVFEVSVEGYATAIVEANPGDEDLRVVMLRHGALRGSVLLPDGTPAARARVWDIDANRAVSCDDAGRFLLEGLPPGPQTFNITAEHEPEGCALRCEATLDIGGGVTAEESFTLEERIFSHLWLRVLEGDHLPAKPWTCEAVLGTRRYAGTTDMYGDLLIRCDAPPGAEVTRLVSRSADHGIATWRAPLVTVTEAATQPQLVQLVAAPTLEIVALGPGGEALPADRLATIMVGVELSRVSVSHDRARFAFDPSDVTGFSFAIDAAGYVRHWARLSRPPVAGERIEVRLARGGCAFGRVARGAAKEVAAAAMCIGEGPRWVGADVTGDAFEIAGIPPGPFLLHVKAGRLPQECAGRFVIRADEGLDLGTVAVPPPRWVEGRVLRGDGRGLGGAEIRVHDGIDGSPEEGESYYSSADGSFRVPATSTGTPRLLVRKRGFATRGLKLDSVEPPMVTLDAGTRFLVRVLCAPLEDSAITITVEDPTTGLTWRPHSEGITRRGGTIEWRYADLGPGPVTFIVYVGRERHTIPAEVLSDGTGSATLDLSR